MVGGFVIRTATRQHQAFISAMQYAALFVPPGEPPLGTDVLDEPDIRRYHAGFGTRDGDVGRVAESVTGVPIGAAWTRLVEGYGFVDHDTPELAVAVRAEERGRGVGTELLEALLAEVPRCSLSVDARKPARRLYERLGFRTVRRDGDRSVVLLRTPSDRLVDAEPHRLPQ